MMTKDVGRYTIVAGTPARHSRQRRPRAIAERLIALGGWDWDHARLLAALQDFRSLPAGVFLDAYGG